MSAEDEAGGGSSGQPQSTGKLSKLGRFIQTYHSFLSSSVIGVAGPRRHLDLAAPAIADLVGELEHGADHLGRTYNARRAASTHERANPPPMMMIRKVNFCGAAALSDAAGGAKP